MREKLFVPVSAALALSLLAFGCARTEPRALESREAAVVYGSDDRRDVYDHPDASMRTLAAESVVTLFTADVLDMSNPQDVQFRGFTLQDRLGLCAGERFADQPTGGSCSGTLIDDNLVLTAGHCVTSDDECRNMRVVFGYYYESQGSLSTVTSEDVFSCVSRRAWALEDANGLSLDYAIVQLDRSASPRYTPATVNADSRGIVEGTSVAVIGSGSGLPLKIDTGGTVRNARASARDFFVTNLDTFGGNSGSGVFDPQTGEVVGILVSGDTDYVESGGCTVVNECSSSGCAGENVTYVANAVNDFCDDFSSARLCDTDAVCGDGFCGSGESNDNCPSDCAAAECGNGICEAGESESCDDCVVDGPGGWTCEPSYYGTRDGCDCNCGVRDPDCDIATQIVLNCNEGEICNAGGSCAVPGAGDCGNGVCDGDETAGSCPNDCGGEIPSDWICNPDFYGVLDGCDCDCGAWDPDCSDASQPIHGCAQGAVCETNGTCSVQEWFCEPSYFDALDGCDCDCGIYDPDCEFFEQELLNCAEGQFCNAEGRCASSGERPPQRSQGCFSAVGDQPRTGWWFALAVMALLIRIRPSRRRP